MKNQAIPRFLAVLAIVSIVLYAINCRPAWSPDGKEVAYVYYGKKNDKDVGGIAIYNVRTGSNDSIVEIEETEDDQYVPMQVFWTDKGKDLYYISKKGEDRGKITKYNLKTKKSGLVTILPFEPAIINSLLERDRWLWIFSEDDKVYYRVDLRDGGLKKGVKKDISLLYGNKKKLFYIQGTGEDELDQYIYREIGANKDSFTVPKLEDLEFSSLFTMPAKAVRFGYFIKEKDGASSLMVVDDEGELIRKIILPEFCTLDDDYNPEVCSAWDKKGRRIWFSTDMKTKEGEKVWGFLEINLKEPSIKVIGIRGEYRDSKPFMCSLSPDERYLAVTLVNDDEDFKTCLCLIDVKAEDRKVTAILPPGIEKKK
jgi:hypothetical protein